jgi:hypothetical protein
VGSTKKWERIDTYSGKLVENVVQAISSDLLCHAMQRLEAAGCRIAMHIHDEVVIEAPRAMEVDEVGREWVMCHQQTASKLPKCRKLLIKSLQIFGSYLTWT